MAKSLEYEHHQPRPVANKKKTKTFTEDTLESRGSRVSFKNYMRQLKEEEISAEADGSEWAVLRGIEEDGHFRLSEVAVFLSEEEAQEEVDKLSDSEPEDSGIIFRVEQV